MRFAIDSENNLSFFDVDGSLLYISERNKVSLKIKASSLFLEDHTKSAIFHEAPLYNAARSTLSKTKVYDQNAASNRPSFRLLIAKRLQGQTNSSPSVTLMIFTNMRWLDQDLSGKNMSWEEKIEKDGKLLVTLMCKAGRAKNGYDEIGMLLLGENMPRMDFCVGKWKQTVQHKRFSPFVSNTEDPFRIQGSPERQDMSVMGRKSLEGREGKASMKNRGH